MEPPSTTGKGNVRHSGSHGSFDITTSSGRRVPTHVVGSYVRKSLSHFPGADVYAKAYRRGYNQTHKIYANYRHQKAPIDVARALALETMDRKKTIHTGGDQKKAFYIAQRGAQGAKNALEVLLLKVPATVACAVQIKNPYDPSGAGNNSCLPPARKLFD